jgi:hypothetical protein
MIKWFEVVHIASSLQFVDDYNYVHRHIQSALNDGH